MVCARMRGPLHRPRSCPCLFHASCIVLSNYVGVPAHVGAHPLPVICVTRPPSPQGRRGPVAGVTGAAEAVAAALCPSVRALSLSCCACACAFFIFIFFFYFSLSFFVSLLSACLSACWTSGLCIAYGGLSAKWTCDGADALSYQGYQGTDCKEEKGPGFRVSGLGFGI